MNRLITPLILFGTAAWLVHFNGTHDDRAMFLPFMDVIDPGSKGDPAAMGRDSAVVIGGLALLSLVWAIVGIVRDRLRKPDE